MEYLFRYRIPSDYTLDSRNLEGKVLAQKDLRTRKCYSNCTLTVRFRIRTLWLARKAEETSNGAVGVGGTD
jgi:hypothetical protein